jgi:sugar fermentation stimulation protein A
MTYNKIKRGVFVSRPNRFIAHVEVGGQVEICHVKNTGRCKELLIPNAAVLLAESQNPTRKTRYDLVAVYKGDRLINMDSQAPNQVMGEWLSSGGCFGRVSLVKPECFYKNSRFDFYVEADGRRIFIEVKGVTLEKDGVVLFPDAPTERGIKHLRELMDAKENGYEAYVFFVIQMEDCRYFTPNRATHAAFADALTEAAAAGVEIRAVTCRVTEDSLFVLGSAEVRL